MLGLVGGWTETNRGHVGVEQWGELSSVAKLLNGVVYIKLPSHLDIKRCFSLLPLNYPPGLCCSAEHDWS